MANEPAEKYDLRITIGIHEPGNDDIEDTTHISVTLNEVERSYLEKFAPISAVLHGLDEALNGKH